jgi:hypothetical protein
MVDSGGRAQVVDGARDYDRKDIDRGAQVHEPGFESDFDRDKKGFYRHKGDNDQQSRNHVGNKLIHTLKDNTKYTLVNTFSLLIIRYPPLIVNFYPEN